MYMSTDIRVVDFFPGRDPSIKVRGSAIKRKWNVLEGFGYKSSLMNWKPKILKMELRDKEQV